MINMFYCITLVFITFLFLGCAQKSSLFEESSFVKLNLNDNSSIIILKKTPDKTNQNLASGFKKIKIKDNSLKIVPLFKINKNTKLIHLKDKKIKSPIKKKIKKIDILK